MTVLNGTVCRLRPIHRRDLEASIGWRNDPETRSLVMGYPFPVTEVMETAWYDRALADQAGKRASFAVSDLQTEAAIGFVHLMDIDWVCRSCELGIVIGDRARRGQNFGSEATRLVVDYAFSGLNLARIGVRVAAPNKGAYTLFRKIGFRDEGNLRNAAFVNGRAADVILMGLLAGEQTG
jgi:diamine N-acetyltransferase